MADQIIKASVKYDDEQRAWRWWVGLIDGPIIVSHGSGWCRSRNRAQSKIDKVAKQFQARIDTDNRPAQEMVYDPVDGGWREVPRG